MRAFGCAKREPMLELTSQRGRLEGGTKLTSAAPHQTVPSVPQGSWQEQEEYRKGLESRHLKVIIHWQNEGASKFCVATRRLVGGKN